MPPTLVLQNIGQLQNANLEFGDLTVFVGPQASGKSIALQWLKLVNDAGQIQSQLRQYGMDWHKEVPSFLDLYFGEGMRSTWDDAKSQVNWDGKPWKVHDKISRKQKDMGESVFLIPAQRVLTLRDGWPRPFSDYSTGDPFSVRWFSERLRLLMEQELSSPDAVFPRSNRLKGDYREQLEQTVFKKFQLTVETNRPQKRLVLGRNADTGKLPYMVWSAGQREFVPLLLGLYWLLPPAKISKRKEIEWVIIEEPEMGMHPRAITTVLLLLLELLHRGYRVCVSTHSPQVLELIWVLQSLRSGQSSPDDVLHFFSLKKKPELIRVAESALAGSYKVYYFDGDEGVVRDITDLNPSSVSEEEATWGGMLDFSERANNAVASAISNIGPLFES